VEGKHYFLKKRHEKERILARKLSSVRKKQKIRQDDNNIAAPT
jgi:hypothetical protein